MESLPSFNLGKVKNVVDERQKRVAGAFDDVHIGRLIFIKTAAFKDVSKAEDAVHRRSQFMAHGRQERCFGFIRLLRKLFCHDKLLFSRNAVRNFSVPLLDRVFERRIDARNLIAMASVGKCHQDREQNQDAGQGLQRPYR